MPSDRNVPSDVRRKLIAISEGRNPLGLHNDNSQTMGNSDIDQIEKIIGEALFTKGHGGTRLTSAGKDLLEVARRILADNDVRLGSWNAVSQNDQIRLGISSMLLDFLVESRATKLPTNINVRSDICSKIVSSFDAQEIDVAMVMDVKDHRATLGHHVVAEFDVEFAWMKSEALVLEADAPLPLATWPPDQHIILNALSDAGIRYDIIFAGPEYASKFTAVRSGTCLAVVPRNAIAAPFVEADDAQLPPIASRKILLAVRGDADQQRFKNIVSLLSSFPLAGSHDA